MRKLRKRRRGRLGAGGGGIAAGPVLAVPEPVGGRLPVMGVVGAVGCAGVLGGVGAVCVGFEVTVACMGPVGTPATVLSSANALCKAY